MQDDFLNGEQLYCLFSSFFETCCSDHVSNALVCCCFLSLLCSSALEKTQTELFDLKTKYDEETTAK